MKTLILVLKVFLKVQVCPAALGQARETLYVSSMMCTVGPPLPRLPSVRRAGKPRTEDKCLNLSEKKKKTQIERWIGTSKEEKFLFLLKTPN